MAREVVPAGVRATAQWSVGGGGGRGRGAGGEGAVSGGCEIDPFILHNSDESCLTAGEHYAFDHLCIFFLIVTRLKTLRTLSKADPLL